MSSYETCRECDSETGRAGASEDSLYHSYVGPFCEDCYDDWPDKIEAELAKVRREFRDFRAGQAVSVPDAWCVVTNDDQIQYTSMVDKNLGLPIEQSHDYAWQQCNEVIQEWIELGLDAASKYVIRPIALLATPTKADEQAHKRVHEYDGAHKCLDCGAQWGALPGHPDSGGSSEEFHRVQQAYQEWVNGGGHE